MTKTRTLVEKGLEQMGYEVVDNGVMNLPCSTPAVYEFATPSELDGDTFEENITAHDFTIYDTFSREQGDQYLYSASVVTDHYKKVNLRTSHESLRVFPDEQPPDRYELSRILHAVEDAFGSDLVWGDADE